MWPNLPVVRDMAGKPLVVRIVAPEPQNPGHAVRAMLADPGLMAECRKLYPSSLNAKHMPK